MPSDPHFWRTRASCLGMDPDLWTDVPPGNNYPVEAMRVCRDCPVRRPCLDYALTLPDSESTGVWGGTTEKSRREVRHGHIDRFEAMARGDELADRRTEAERVAAEEPWLAGRAG